MTKKLNNLWTTGIAVNLVSSLFAFIVGVVVTFLERAGSAWVKPITFGTLTWLLVFTLFYLFRLGLRLPARTEAITDDNLEEHMREWMDRYNLTVQRFNDPALLFSFLVTTVGEKKIAIKRRKSFPEYILISADMAALNAEEKRIFDGLSEQDQTSAMAEVRLELTRAVVGLVIPKTMPEGYTVFRQLPITSSLSESQFVREIWNIEAVVNSIYAVTTLIQIRLRHEGKIAAQGR